MESCTNLNYRGAGVFGHVLPTCCGPKDQLVPSEDVRLLLHHEVGRAVDMPYDVGEVAALLELGMSSLSSDYCDTSDGESGHARFRLAYLDGTMLAARTVFAEVKPMLQEFQALMAEVRQLLRPDGVVLVELTSEQYQYRAILDKVFGYDNFLGEPPWTAGPVASAAYPTLLVYARSKLDRNRHGIHPDALHQRALAIAQNARVGLRDLLHAGAQDYLDVDSLVESLFHPIAPSQRWDRLSAESFELLVGDLLRAAPEYENVEQLMHTNAPDRGRDLVARRVSKFSYGQVLRQRVEVQAKHYVSSKAVGLDEVTQTLTLLQLWGPPPVDVLLFVTSGKFTLNLVQWVDQHNAGTRRPLIELWSRSELEVALSEHPALVLKYGL